MGTNIKISDIKYGLTADAFAALMDNMKCETGDDIEIVGFRSKINNFEISFHGDMENGHDLTVEDFGAMTKGEWVQMEPTDLQMDRMQRAILDKVDELLQEPEPIQYQENYGIYSQLY